MRVTTARDSIRRARSPLLCTGNIPSRCDSCEIENYSLATERRRRETLSTYLSVFFSWFRALFVIRSTSPKCFQRRGERKGARRCATRPAQGSLIGRTRVKVPATVGKITTNGRNVGKSRYARKRNGRVINLSHSHTLLSFSRGDITDIAAWLHVDFCTKIRPAISRGGLFSAEQNTSRVTFLLLLPSRTRIPTFPGSRER